MLVHAVSGQNTHTHTHGCMTHKLTSIQTCCTICGDQERIVASNLKIQFYSILNDLH